jgi:hypothetical protein
MGDVVSELLKGVLGPKLCLCLCLSRLPDLCKVLSLFRCCGLALHLVPGLVSLIVAFHALPRFNIDLFARTHPFVHTPVHPLIRALIRSVSLPQCQCVPHRVTSHLAHLHV